MPRCPAVLISVVAAGAAVLTSCSGSGGSATAPIGPSQSTSESPATSESLPIASDPPVDSEPPVASDPPVASNPPVASDPPVSSSAPVAAGPSAIVNNYDTATCSDWTVTDAGNRKIVTTYFLVRANDRKLDGLEVALETAITTACAQLPSSITVKRVAQTAIKDLQQIT